MIELPVRYRTQRVQSFSWTGCGHRGSGVNRWMVRGQNEEQADQMCLSDKKNLVPASLNHNRYQLAQGRQGAGGPVHG